MNNILPDIFLQICLNNKCRNVATNKVKSRRPAPDQWRDLPCFYKCTYTWEYLTNPVLCPVKLVYFLFNLRIFVWLTIYSLNLSERLTLTPTSPATVFSIVLVANDFYFNLLFIIT